MHKIIETDLRFEIDSSTIPGAGMGLFAKQTISKGDYLEIIGVMVDVSKIEHICTKFADTYKFAAEPIHQFQHAVIPLGFAAMVNHADKPERQNVAIAHLPADREERNEHAGQVVYMALRDIKSGEEILANYNRKGSEKSARSANELIAWKQLLGSNFYGLDVLVKEKSKLIVNRF